MNGRKLKEEMDWGMKTNGREYEKEADEGTWK